MTSWVDVIDHIVDKGVVIDGGVAVSLLGVIDLLTIETRVVVASIQTYVEYRDSFSQLSSLSDSLPSVPLPAMLSDNRD